MSRCKSCDERIVWIRTTAGKLMPLDEGAFYFVADAEGGEIAVAVSGDRIGEAIRGRTVSEGTAGAFVARTSHFASCPAASQHRKKKE